MSYTLIPNAADTCKNTVTLSDVNGNSVTACDYGSHEVISYSQAVVESSRQSGQITGATVTTTMTIRNKSLAGLPDVIVKIVARFQKNTGSERDINRGSSAAVGRVFPHQSQPGSPLFLLIPCPNTNQNCAPGRGIFIRLEQGRNIPNIILCQKNKNIAGYLRPIQHAIVLPGQNGSVRYPGLVCSYSRGLPALPKAHFGNAFCQPSGRTDNFQGNRHFLKPANLNLQNTVMQKMSSTKGHIEVKSPSLSPQNMAHRQGDIKSNLLNRENIYRYERGLMKGSSDLSARSGVSMEGKDSVLMGRKELQTIRAGGESRSLSASADLNGKNSSTVQGIGMSLPLNYQNKQDVKRYNERPGVSDKVHGVCFFPDRDKKKRRKRKVGNLFIAGFLLIIVIMLMMVFISTY